MILREPDGVRRSTKYYKADEREYYIESFCEHRLIVPLNGIEYNKLMDQQKIKINWFYWIPFVYFLLFYLNSFFELFSPSLLLTHFYLSLFPSFTKTQGFPIFALPIESGVIAGLLIVLSISMIAFGVVGCLRAFRQKQHILIFLALVLFGAIVFSQL